ncbi:predicted saccharopine dehydrogenase [gamma proteobacterium HdN1]|nr:predicted saccharopine dehydrogenase [gamma proteobacterium HdN1]
MVGNREDDRQEMSGTDKKYDVVVWGATGFSGRPAALHLNRFYASQGKIRMAVAARSKSRLQALLKELDSPEIDMLVCPGDDAEAAAQVARSARVVCSAVGPAARWSTPMVDACIAHGTDYCDLSGELHWLRKMIDTRDAIARARGVLILNATGVDSIPTEYGVQRLQQAAREAFGEYCVRVKGCFAHGKIAVAGGSFLSGKGVMEAIADDPEMREIISNPYSINPTGDLHGYPPCPDLEHVVYDEDFAQYIKPFPVGQINARVVRRAHSLAGYPYGHEFTYIECALAGHSAWDRLKAILETRAVGLFVNTNPRTPLGKMLMALGPREGSGPSDEQMHRNGPFGFVYWGRTQSGKVMRSWATSPLDVHRATAAMMAETAVYLAKQRADVLQQGGFWTPGTAIGDALLKPLQRHRVLDTGTTQGLWPNIRIYS